MLQIPAGAVRLFRTLEQGGGLSPNCGVYHCLHTNCVGGNKVPTGTCPECDADVHVDLDTDKGEIVSCEECGTELEIVGLDPVELDIVEEESYDEDEDEDEY
jgi:alpha-aminoadipate/glutamate carrier protein LysW